MTTPVVSVLLPVHNGAATVARAIASVQAQRETAWELIVVENGSTDDSAAVVRELASGDQRIQIVNMPVANLVAALNEGLKRCQGEFVARMDADDEMLPERLSKQVAVLRNQPDWGVVGCGVRFGGDTDAQAGYAEHVRWLNQQITPEQLWLSRFVESPLAHPSVMWRRSVSDHHGAYQEGDFPEDYELWLRWWEAGVKFGKIADELLIWHDSPGRLSRSDSRYRTEAFYRTKARFIAGELARSGRGRDVWIAGAGRPTRSRAAELEAHGVTIVGYLDVDPKKIGQRIDGCSVVGPDALPAKEDVMVLSYVGNRGAREKVRALLESQGRREGQDFWLCA